MWRTERVLTEHELSRIQTELQRWSGVHRSTARADRGVAETAIQALYKTSGLPAPAQIVWCRSPAEMARLWFAEMGRLGPDRLVKSIVIDAARQEIDRNIIDAAHAPLRFQLINAIRSGRQTFNRFVADEGFKAGAKAWPRRQWLLSCLTSPLRGSHPTFATAAHCFKTDDSIAIHSAMFKLAPADQTLLRLKSYLDLAEQVEWVLPYGGTCWVSERPVKLSVDADGRCHAAGGPAIAYEDDFKIYAWKGVEILERAVLEPNSISIYDIARTRDPVVRRCLIDLMTPERFVALRGATCIARDEYGKLWRRSWRLDAWAAVEVLNGTPELDGSFKKYYLQVPAHFQTPRQAVAWTYGLLPEQYALRQRT